MKVIVVGSAVPIVVISTNRMTVKGCSSLFVNKLKVVKGGKMKFSGNELIKMFNDLKQMLYDHVGFVEDWVVYAVDDKTDMVWKIVDSDVKYAETTEKFYSTDGDYYIDEIYKQRFYDKHIYRGKNLTMIIVDTHVDGNRFFAFYSNDKEIE